MLARLFRKFPGMEYCDLKKDKKTNRSKVRLLLISGFYPVFCRAIAM